MGAPTDWLTDCLILIYLNDLLIDLFVYFGGGEGGLLLSSFAVLFVCFCCLEGG